MEAFQKFLMARRAISACILNPAYTLLAFLLLTLYHLLIQHYIFNDHIGRNVWNLGYKGNWDLFNWGVSHIAGGGLLARTEGVGNTMRAQIHTHTHTHTHTHKSSKAKSFIMQ